MAKKSQAKRTYKLDIMTVLEAADKGMKDFYVNLTEEEQKAFAPKVLIRWLSSVSDKSDFRHYSILAVNDLVNLGLWSLAKHPELVWLLMCVAGTGRKQYHQWIPQSKTAGTTPKLDAFVAQHWPQTNSVERNLLKTLKTPAEWLDLARGSGMDDRSLKEFKDELKKLKTDQDH